MDKRPLTDGEKVAVRIAKNKAAANKNRDSILSYYTTRKQPKHRGDDKIVKYYE